MRFIDSLLFLIPFLSLSCAGPDRVLRHPLSDQILKPRAGFKGLTNKACDEFNEKLECVRESVKEYSFSDPVFRDTVNKLGFICEVGGRRFKICTDKPGLCRISYKEKCFLFFCHKERKEEFIPAEPYQFLLDANVECKSERVYE